MEPFKNLGMTTLTIRNTGGTDHLSYDAVGLPGFQFIQDEVEYDSRTHHSNMDVYERIQASDMMQNAVIVASFVVQRGEPRREAAAQAAAQADAAGAAARRSRKKKPQRPQRTAAVRSARSVRPSGAVRSLRSLASGISSSRSTGQGSRYVQLSSLTVAGSLIRSRQPNASCTGSSSRSDPDAKSASSSMSRTVGLYGALREVGAGREPLHRSAAG